MKVRIWGCRGSVPSPLRPQEIREKIRLAILQLPNIDTSNPDQVDSYLDQLSPLRFGTAGGNTTCVEIQTGQDTFIIDAGTGIRTLSMKLMKGPCGRGEGTVHLFFTHAHWDHIQGFPFFTPALVPGNNIYIHSIHDLEAVLNSQQQSVNFPLPLSAMAANIKFIRHNVDEKLTIGDVEISMLKNSHPGDAYSYRFKDAYSTFIFASDAEYKLLDEPNLRPYLDFFKSADVLVFDTQYTLREGFQKTDWGHSSAMIGVDLARLAGVKTLVLFHHDPTYSDEQLLDIQQRTLKYQDQDVSYPPCEVVVAYEGLVFDLTPPGTVNLKRLEDEAGAILTPTGNFDDLGVVRLQEQLARLEELGWPDWLVIDLSQTESIAIAGLKTLITLRKERPDTPIVLACVPSQVYDVIDLVGLLDHFAIYSTIEAAAIAMKASESLNMSGQVIQERYQIESRLDEAWHGVTFKATDLEKLDKVSITVLSPSLGAKSIDHLMRRAQQLTDLAHPQITNILDSYQDSTIAYIVEPFVEDQTLYDKLRDVRTSADGLTHARQISIQMLNALEYAHSRGVMHYNLTPHNIILGQNLRLRNFYIGSSTEQRSLLNSPLIWREAPYLAPEQIQGQPPNARTDLYALGVIMYELFTGQLPYSGSDQEVMEAHVHQAPRPPRDLNPEMSRSLEHLILKLLAKDPNDRYVTAHQTNQILCNLIISNDDEDSLSALRYTHNTSLVNRTSELNQMDQAWQDVQQSSSAKLVVVQGEMGIGKTRLIVEFLTQHIQAQGATALIGRCDEFGLPYTPYAEILATIFNKGLIDPQSIADRGQYLTRQIPMLNAILSPYQSASSTNVATDSQQGQWHFFSTVSLILGKLGAAVLYLENAEYLDETSVALTRFLIRRSRQPLLIIASTRNDEGDVPWLTSLKDANPKTVTLKPLLSADVAAYLNNRLGGNVSDNIVNIINSRSHGNPYFIEEITQHLIDKGTLKQDDNGTWVYISNGSTDGLPPTLMRVFAERVGKLAESRQIEKLTDSSRQALRVAAVIGPEFRFDIWVAVLGGTAQEDIALDALDEAIALRLIKRMSNNQYAFDPIDLADVLASSLEDTERTDLHQRIAETLRQHDENPILISQHYAEAGVHNEAAQFLALAATKAMAANATNEAITYYTAAMHLIESQSGYEALGSLYRQKGAAAESTEAFEKALEMARAANDVPSQAHILNELTLTAWLYDQYKQAYQTAHTVLDLPNIPKAEYATAQSHLGMIAWVVGRLAEAEIWCRRAVKMMKGQDEDTRFGSLYNRLGLAYLSRGKLNDATTSFKKSLDIRRRTGDQWGQAYCLNNLGKIFIEQGNFDQATKYLTTAQYQFQEIDSADGLLVVYTNQGRLKLRQGHLGEALAYLVKAIEISQKLTKPNAYYMADVYLQTAETCLRRNDTAAARSSITEALKIAESAGNMEHVASGKAISARIYAADGNAEAANTQFNEALERFEQVSSPSGLIRTKLQYAQFLSDQGNTENTKSMEDSAQAEAKRLGIRV